LTFLEKPIRSLLKTLIQVIAETLLYPVNISFDKKMKKFDGLEIKSAEAAGQIQFAINLLNQRLVQLIQSKLPGKEKSDFNQSLRTIHQNAKTFFPKREDQNGIQKKFDRARQIRNQYSHQDFDLNRFEHDVECLAKIASLVGAKDVEEKIRERITSVEKCKSSILDKSDWKHLKEEGNVHFSNKRWTEAMNSYTKAIRINPNIATIYSNRALCEIRLSKFQLAREDAEDALELEPGQVKYYRILSEAVLNLALFEEAYAACEAGLEIDPRDETLLLRQRDCKAMIIDQEIKTHPVGGSLNQHRPASVIKKLQSQFWKSDSDVLPEEIQPCSPSYKETTQDIVEAQTMLSNRGINIENEMRALKVYEVAAQKGSANGLYNLSQMYFNGKAGLARDFVKGIEYSLKAADQKPFISFQGSIIPNIGVAEAENQIAMCYRDGMGVDEDKVLAFQWFLRSAQHECPSAQNNLGDALYQGKGCSKNLTSARKWFEKGAEQWQAEAQYNLAKMLIQGEGGPADAPKAADLLRAAAKQGLPHAWVALQDLLRSGATGAKSMSDSVKIIQDSAKEDDKDATFLLGFNCMRRIQEKPGRSRKKFEKSIRA
jgi:TPR repeat protein